MGMEPSEATVWTGMVPLPSTQAHLPCTLLAYGTGIVTVFVMGRDGDRTYALKFGLFWAVLMFVLISR